MALKSLGSAACLSLLAFVVLLGSSSRNARADDRVLQTPSGALTFHLNEYRNDNGEKEISIELDEVRAFLPDTRAVVLWGRDLDSDGKYDAWFYHGESGVVEATDLRASDPNDPTGWDAASKVLLNRVKLSNRWYAAVLFGSVTSAVSLTASAQKASFAELARAQTDLRDLEIRTNRLYAIDRLTPGLTHNYELIANGWEDLSQRVISRDLRNVWINGLGDFAFYMIGGAIVRGAASVIGWAGKKVAGAEAMEMAEKYYNLYLEDLARKAGEMADKLRVRKLEFASIPGMAAASQAVRMTSITIADRIGLTLRAMESQNRLSKILVAGTRKSYEAGKSGLREWRYIGVSQGVQLMAEIANRKDTVFDPNPIVLAKKVVSDHDLIQNLSYMSAETFLQSAISSYSPNVAQRMMICGFVSMLDSVSMNLLIKGEGDPKRVGLDTGWQVVIGNILTNVDLTALKYFSAAAERGPNLHLSITQGGATRLGSSLERTPNPRLKLVGYAIAIVDQAAGYLAYGAVTQKLEKSKRSDESAKSGESERSKPELVSHQIRWVPIYAPAW